MTTTDNTKITRRAALGAAGGALALSAFPAIPNAAPPEPDTLRDGIEAIVHELRHPTEEMQMRITVGAHRANLVVADRIEALLKGGAS